jgi:hypothetical protein
MIMAGSASNYLEEKYINSAFRGDTFPVPTRLYIALYTASPGEAGGVNEVTGGWYTRMDMAAGGAISTAFTPPADGTTSNAKNILFPAVTGAAVTITHVALHDAPTGGNMLYYTDLVQAKTLQIGDVFSVPVGGMSITAT